MCEITVKMHCLHCCNSANVIKMGKNKKIKEKKQNLLCKSCKKQFLYDYTYTGYHPSKRKSVVKHLLRSCGIRDVKALEKISYDFIYNTLRSSSSFSWEPRLDTYASVLIDELYLIVKKNERKRSYIVPMLMPKKQAKYFLLQWAEEIPNKQEIYF